MFPGLRLLVFGRLVFVVPSGLALPLLNAASAIRDFRDERSRRRSPRSGDEVER